MKLLANISHKKYKLPDIERSKCKIRYNIYLAIVYLNKGKLIDCMDCIQKVMEVNKDPFEAICCFNILALCECHAEKHGMALEYHFNALEACKCMSNPVYESVNLYNLTVEYLHLDDFNKSKEFVFQAFEIAEKSKSNKNLIFSKILLLYQEINRKDFKKDCKMSSVNTLKKKTLEFMFKEKANENRPREISLTRGRQPNNPDPLKVISLGNKFTKKRSKTEHRPKRNTTSKLNKEIFENFKKESAAKTIQRAWKAYKSEKQQRIEKELKSEAQKFCLEKLAKIWKKIPKTLKIILTKAKKTLVSKIVKIQSLYRKFSCSKQLKHLKNSTWKIQALVKGKKIRKDYLKILKAIARIQAFARGCAERKYLKKCQIAALIIQKQARVYLLKAYIKRNWKFRRFVRKSVISTIKNIANGIRKTVVNEVKSNALAIVKVQSFMRMVPKRLYFKVLRISTCCIQRHVRGYLQRKNLKRQQKSAIKIQKFLKSKFPQMLEYEISCY